MTIKREDLDMTAIVEAAFQSLVEAKGLTSTLSEDVLPKAKIEQMKRSMVAPIWHSLNEILSQVQAKSDEDILAAFTIPDTLEGFQA
ncbi:MAG TPA: hypothetical protein VF867_13275 [Arthrobacter sp.]